MDAAAIEVDAHGTVAFELRQLVDAAAQDRLRLDRRQSAEFGDLLRKGCEIDASLAHERSEIRCGVLCRARVLVGVYFKFCHDVFSFLCSRIQKVADTGGCDEEVVGGIL